MMCCLTGSLPAEADHNLGSYSFPRNANRSQDVSSCSGSTEDRRELAGCTTNQEHPQIVSAPYRAAKHSDDSSRCLVSICRSGHIAAHPANSVCHHRDPARSLQRPSLTSFSLSPATQQSVPPHNLPGNTLLIFLSRTRPSPKHTSRLTSTLMFWTSFRQ